jgi:L-serine dehydratase
MTVSVFDLFSIGIGPSSSHTVGPMRAAADFVALLEQDDALDQTAAVTVDLYGSLAATGHGHGTLTAIAVGLEGNQPDEIEPEALDETLRRIESTGILALGHTRTIPFRLADIVLRPLTVLARHTNGIRFTAIDSAGTILRKETYFSIGGGFIEREGHLPEPLGSTAPVPFPFASGRELLTSAEEHRLPISGIMLANELTTRTEHDVRAGLLRIHAVMEDSVARSLEREGTLPGGLAVRRRARSWHESLASDVETRDPSFAIDWVNLVALAVNEENASGGRVVTAPTNGAAGIIPAVLHYALNYIPDLRHGPDETRADAVVRFLLTAGAIGSLYKERASISGAEVGCQGEVGSAASMAAAGLAELLGGTPEQVENAAEIAMEHNLGLTCDPIGGLVQIPCIERNAIGSVKAVNAARMALRGDGEHHVSLDQVIETMRQTGADMSTKYKETALGGLAVNVPLC